MDVIRLGIVRSRLVRIARSAGWSVKSVKGCRKYFK